MPNRWAFDRMAARTVTPLLDKVWHIAFDRGYDIATARAESRLRIGWPLERMSGEDIAPNDADPALHACSDAYAYCGLSVSDWCPLHGHAQPGGDRA